MTARFTGPVERRTWPTELVGTVVTPEGDRLHGYALEDDLAAHYSASDVAWLAYAGELPDEATSAAFATWWILASAVPVAEAPAHAAVLAATCGARPAGEVQVAATVLAEQAASWIEAARADADAAAADVTAPAGAVFGSRTRVLRHATRGADLATPPAPWGVELVRALQRLGLSDPRVVCACLVAARLPACVAEAATRRAGAFDTYPMNLPPFEYVEEP